VLAEVGIIEAAGVKEALAAEGKKGDKERGLITPSRETARGRNGGGN